MFQYLLDQDYGMKLVENATVRHMREKIFPGVAKTEEMEAWVMAHIAYLHEAVGEEFTLRPLELSDPEDTHLLALCRDSWKPSTMITRARNQFAQLMAVTFPELKTFFTSSVSTVVPVSLVVAYPTPALLAAAPAEEVRQVLWNAGGYQHAHRVAELQCLACDSSGLLPNPGRAWRLEWLTDFLLTNFRPQAALDKRIEELVERRDAYGAYTGYFAGLEKSQTIDRARM